MADDVVRTLKDKSRVLFAVPLRPLQGQRFQPTGFPNLGAATYATANGTSLLVESAQSMANRLELTCWDEAKKAPVDTMAGISHVTVNRKGAFLTDSILESHRLNSPYLLEGKDKTFFNQLKADLGGLEEGPVNRSLLAQTLLKHDVGSLLHGVFLAKKDLAGGRLRVARAVSAFIEADGTNVAASGGVKNDHVHPSRVDNDPKNLFGNIPFARDEYTAERITLYVNLDCAQLRGYGLGEAVTGFLTLLALYKLRALLDGNLRLRTACDLEPVERQITATAPAGFMLPSHDELVKWVKASIAECGDRMKHTTVTFEDELKKAKEDAPEEEATPDEEDAGD